MSPAAATATADATANTTADSTAEANATASAANKTWIFKRKIAVVSWKHYRSTRISLAAINGYCHRAAWGFKF